MTARSGTSVTLNGITSGRMAVNDGVNVRALLVDFGMDETLAIDAATLTVDRLAFGVEFHDVSRGDQLGTPWRAP